MPDLRTDDGPRSLRAVWLGPKGATLPFEWTYVQWLVTLACGAVVGFGFGLVGWLLVADVVYAVAACLLWGWPAGMYLGVRAMRGVTFDEPLRCKANMLRAQLGRRDHRPAPRPVRLQLTWPVIRPDCHATSAARRDKTAQRVEASHVPA